MPSVVAAVKANPFLHFEPERIYNPITDRSLLPGEPLYDAMRAFLAGGVASDALLGDGWVVRDGAAI
jgi:hypothetical protein